MDEWLSTRVVRTPAKGAPTTSITTGSACPTAEPPLDHLLCRVRHEYLEMPGLRLTLEQAERLWQLRRGECEALLGTLVESGFLVRTGMGMFVRAG